MCQEGGGLQKDTWNGNELEGRKKNSFFETGSSNTRMHNGQLKMGFFVSRLSLDL